jgi:Kef-type K+ transport system membrane component KefB
MSRATTEDRWYLGLIWLACSAFGAGWCGLHFMAGAFLAGAVLDPECFDAQQLQVLRNNILLAVMPVFFLITGLRTKWNLQGGMVVVVAASLLLTSVAGKLVAMKIAGAILGWEKDDAFLIGWFLQTKALIMIIFTNILLEQRIITSETFTVLMLMAIGSTMLTIPVVASMKKRFQCIDERRILMQESFL